MDRGQVVLYFAQKLVLEICFSDLSSPDFQTGHQDLGIILKKQKEKKMESSTMSKTDRHLLR